ncbi:hypothetical protein QT972_23695 [Microcoleus sp. herbarium7]
MPNVSLNAVSLERESPALIQITDRLFDKIGMGRVPPPKNPLQGNEAQ